MRPKSVLMPLAWLPIITLATACAMEADDTEYDVESGESAVSSSGCQVDYVVQESWTGGFKAEVKITNNSPASYNGWKLRWSFPSGSQKLQNLWNGKATQSGSAVTVNNESWNGTVKKGASTKIGFVANGSGSPVPTSFSVNGVACNQASGGGSAGGSGGGGGSSTGETDGVALKWSYAGPIGGMSCTQFKEGADPYTWNDNYLCANQDLGLRWSYAGKITSMHCTKINEPADPHTWNDNYLCAPSDLGFKWSYAGPIAGMSCTKINEPSDPHGWDDNYLCLPQSGGSTGGSGGSNSGGSGGSSTGGSGGTSTGGSGGSSTGGSGGTSPAGTPVATHGKLHVCGTRLCDQGGQVVQLRGISTHGLQWYGWNQRCLNDNAMDSLADQWNADVVRIALYVQEGGYETDPAGYRAMVDTIVDEAGQRGLYALIDWHILNPGDPTYNLDRAKEFFRYMAGKHGNKNHVLFELANEPNGVGWPTIRDYAQQLLTIIRHEKSSDAVTIIGTPDWSSFGLSGGHSADEIVNAPPIDGTTGTAYGNVMYTFHFYAASHGDSYRNLVTKYADILPIFVTEWGTPTYSGDGYVDQASTQAWLELMRQKKISWAYWNWSDNGQSTALFKAGTCNTGNTTWTGNVLQPSGQIIFDALHQ